MSKEIQYADLIGVPFKNLGRDVKSGLDCYGLVVEIYRRCGKEIGEYYSDCSDKARINAILRREVATTKWRRIAEGETLPVPCLVALRFNSPPGVVNHTGVYIGNGRFIHTREKSAAALIVLRLSHGRSRLRDSMNLWGDRP